MGDRHFAGAGVAAGLGTQRDGFRRDPMVCDGAALFYHLFVQGKRFAPAERSKILLTPQNRGNANGRGYDPQQPERGDGVRTGSVAYHKLVIRNTRSLVRVCF